ncbi:hypothetical protein MNBD_GAMMA13-2020, partial [hydrothermal vent metagenome]
RHLDLTVFFFFNDTATTEIYTGIAPKVVRNRLPLQFVNFRDWSALGDAQHAKWRLNR